MIRKYSFLAIFIILACSETRENENLVIAHRGVPYFAPEETLPAYLLARDLGVDYLEADIQRTKDGVLIALHDNSLRRTTNVIEVFPERANEPVNSFTWEELQSLDAGSWFNTTSPDLARESYQGLRIISLEQLIQLLDSTKDQTGIYLETKLPQQFPGIEKDLKEFLVKMGWYNKRLANGSPAVILQSFSPQSIILLREEFPETPITYLLWNGAGCLDSFTQESLTNCLDFAQENDLEFIGASFSGDKTDYFNMLEPWFTSAIEEREMQVHAYTSDTESDITRFAPLTAGQFTNRADLLLDHYNRSHNSVASILKKYNY